MSSSLPPLRGASVSGTPVQCLSFISQLMGRARDWTTTELERQLLTCSSVKMFTTEFKVFNHSTMERSAARGLLNLSQGGRWVADFSIKFRTVAAESKWMLLLCIMHIITNYLISLKISSPPGSFPQAWANSSHPHHPGSEPAPESVSP